MVDDTAERLTHARSEADLFALVKDVVSTGTGRSRAGIMLGLQRLGLSPQGFLGGYFVVGSNAIVLNRDVLDHVRVEAPEHYNDYAFHVLLHEYLHTLGYLDEATVRRLALQLSQKTLGPDHPATLIAAAMCPGASAPGAPDLFRRLVYPAYGWRPATGEPIEVVKGFDLEASPYIA